MIETKKMQDRSRKICDSKGATATGNNNFEGKKKDSE